MAEELTACRMPEEPMFPTLAEGYVVAFVAFYERGFSVLLHRFQHSLLHHCGLELHNLTPYGILHIVAFMTLCETYMEIYRHFGLWNYIFRVQHPQGPKMELTISRAWLFTLGLGMASIPTSTSPCPDR
jgi:hypothetical protein